MWCRPAPTCSQHWWGFQYIHWPPGGTHMGIHTHSAPFWGSKKENSSAQKGSSRAVSSTGHGVRIKHRIGRNRDLWQLRHSRSTVLQAQNARESHVSLTMPAKALVPGIRVSRYLEQWLPWTRLVRSPCERNIHPQINIWNYSRN